MILITYKDWLLQNRGNCTPNIGDKIIVLNALSSCQVVTDTDLERIKIHNNFDTYFKNCYVGIDPLADTNRLNWIESNIDYNITINYPHKDQQQSLRAFIDIQLKNK